MTQQTRQTIALVLAGGRGSRLKNLTDRRAKPAVYFGGKYRIVDFALSNCINSGVRRIFVMTQYKSHSLLRHLQRGWGFLRGDLAEFVDLLPAQQRVEESLWYRGTADAVFQNLDILTSESPDYVLVLAGDHVYKQDYGAMIEAHARSGAEATVCCLEVPREQATAFGVMDVDDTGKVTAFLEKPANPPGLPDKPELTLASMGIYVFNAGFLFDYLAEHAFDTDSSHDFGKDVIPTLVDQGKVMSHRFEDSCIYSPGQTEAYWRDVGTIDAYWEANMDLCSPTPELNLYDKDWRIYTDHPQLPPAKFVFDNDERRGVAVDSVVSGGCIISGSAVRRSFLFSGVRVNSYAQVDEAVILPNVDIGRHARLRRVVVDRGCEIPEGMVVGEDPAEDARRFYRTEDKGITLVTREMLAALNKG